MTRAGHLRGEEGGDVVVDVATFVGRGDDLGKRLLRNNE